MPLNMDKLRKKGISSVGIEISVTDVNPAVALILMRSCIDTNDAQLFSIKAIGCDERKANSAVLGRLDAVLHKNTRDLILRESLKSSKCLAFIYTLFTEQEYTGCGIASNMLEQLHVWIKEEFGFTIDAELLAPAPQWKNEDGEIIQIPMGPVFLHQQKRLVEFYLERGFTFGDDFLIMYKLMGKQCQLSTGGTNERIANSEIQLSTEYWDCECDDKYIHQNITEKCPVCGVLRDEMPDSRQNEIDEGTHFAEE